MIKKYAVIAIILIICVGLFFIFFNSLIKTEQLIPINNPVHADGFPETFTYFANISSINMQNCVSTMALVLRNVFVTEGSYVRKGDLLYILDDSDIAANISLAQAGIQLAQVNLEMTLLETDTTLLISAQASYDAAAAVNNEAKNNLERITALQSLGGISQSDFERAQIAAVTAEGQYNQARNNLETIEQQSSHSVRAARAQLAQARAHYEAANVERAKRHVLAEIDGVVADIWAHENNMLSPGQKIMDIIDYDNLILEIAVDQFEINLFELWETVTVYVNAFDLTVNGTVSGISNQAIITGEVSSFIVTITLERNPALRIGLLAEVKINVNNS